MYNWLHFNYVWMYISILWSFVIVIMYQRMDKRALAMNAVNGFFMKNADGNMIHIIPLDNKEKKEVWTFEE
jgi:hypothetical protein